MAYLLPLTVAIPLGAAFLIPLTQLIRSKKGCPSCEAVAVVAMALLVAVSLWNLAVEGTVTTWMGNYEAKSELLGLTGTTLPATDDAEAASEQPRGVLIEQAAPGSASAEAGLQEGDVITGWKLPSDERFGPLRSMNELRRQNAALEPGSIMILQVERDGSVLEKTVKAGKAVAGIAMVCDGLTRLLLVVISTVSFTAVLFSLSYMKTYTKLHLFYSPLMLMIAGMNGIVVSGDLFNIYVFLEVGAVASFALVGFGVESEELEASFKYLVLSAVASGFILLGIGIVYNLRGTLNLAQIAEFTQFTKPNDAMWLALGFFIAGFGLKAAMVPFHAWLPDAHPSAPAPVSAMLSGVLIKASGVYVIARIVFNVIGVSVPIAYILILMGSASMLIGALLMWGQSDLKRLLAYSSISHMGLVVLALGVGAEVLAKRQSPLEGVPPVAALALLGAMFHLLNHAVFKSLLFLCSGSIVHRTGTRDMNELGGLGQRMPYTCLFTRIGSLSIAGVPPFNGFFSKLVIVIAVVWAGHWALGALTVLASFITLLAFIKVQRYVIEGELPAKFSRIKESPAPMLIAMGILAVLCVGLGVLLPLYSSRLLKPAADSLAQLAGYATSVFGG